MLGRLMLIALWGAAGHTQAAVILNAPTNAGFYDEYTDQLLSGTVYSAQLPLEKGIEGIKLWGTATTSSHNGFQPALVLRANGTASGTLDYDTLLGTAFSFQTDPFQHWIFYASLSTDAGTVDVQDVGTADAQGNVSFRYGIPGTLPAGANAKYWLMALYVGYYNSFGGPSSMTVTIPSNSLDLFAWHADGAAAGAPTPEPGGVALSLFGLLALGLGRARVQRRWIARGLGVLAGGWLLG